MKRTPAHAIRTWNDRQAERRPVAPLRRDTVTCAACGAVRAVRIHGPDRRREDPAS